MESLLFEFGIRSLLIAAGAAVILGVFRVRSAAVRHRVWTSVLFAMLLLPIWIAWGPQVTLRVLPARIVVSPAVQTAVTVETVTRSRTPVEPATSFSRSNAWGVRDYAYVIYASVAALLLLRLILGTVRAHLLIRRSTLCDGILASSSCASPITVGWWNPVAILPNEWREWPQQQLDAVLTHEGEHASRRDPLVQWLALLNRAIFWFHPFSWWLERHLSLLAEEACDEAVLASGHTPQAYSEYLLDMANSVMRSGRRIGATGMAMPGSYLSRRITKMHQEPAGVRISRGRVVCVAVAAIASCVALASSVLVPRAVIAAPLQQPVRVAVAAPKPEPPKAPLVVEAPVQTPAPQAVPEPAKQLIEVEARILTVDKSFSRELGSQLGTMAGNSFGSILTSNSATATSGISFLMQPGGDVLLDRVIEGTTARGSAKVFAHPKIMTYSGMPAEISQGTSFPIQTNTNGTTTLSFQRFALRIGITPSVTVAGTILLAVEIENTQPDWAKAVNGVPSIATQQARTQTLVADGGTMMIGGIYVNERPLLPAATGTRELVMFFTPRIKPPQP
jgi:beta-lactamase regulating signal transducer with metallopeptidase domain